ncbi:MAG: SLBB domain-containing protein [bacterium]
MQGFISSFNPLITRYKSEIVLLTCAFFISIVSAVFFFQQKNNEKIPPITTQKSSGSVTTQKQTSTVDVSGAVKRPFVYTLDSHARIIDAIQRAGGITEDADEAFVRRNVNYARIISDQEKIYVPFLSDTTNGYVLENKKVIDYTQPNVTSKQSEENARININVASVLELDQLPGIGKVQSEAIFTNRPYTTTEDLVSNNVIKQSVYDKIKNLISVY